MRTFESEPMQSGIPRCSIRAAAMKPSGEIGLGGQACARGRVALREQVELGAVRVGRVDDRRVAAEAAGSLEQLDRPAAVLGEALLDLARLLARVHVERQPLGRRVASELLEPVAQARAGRSGAMPTLTPSPRSVGSSWRR